MPWLSLIIAIVTFIIAKLCGASTLSALGVAAAFGIGSYMLVSHFGGSTLQALDGITTPSPGGTGTVGGLTAPPNTSGGIGTAATIGTVATAAITGVAGVLTSFGAKGTAEVLGAAALATNAGGITSTISNNLPLIIGAGVIVAFLIFRKSPSPSPSSSNYNTSMGG